MARDFPKLSDQDHAAVARQLFNEKNGKPVSGYDPKLARCLSVLDGPIPKLWPQFEAMKRIPVLVLRGANSDLLSEATVQEMGQRHPKLSTHTVPDEGHAPLLRDEASIAAVASFFTETDSKGAASPREAGRSHYASRLVSTSPLSTRRENSV